MEKDLYFKDETSKYIFFLVELEGKIQLDFLGVNPSHYSNKEKAKDKIKNIIEKSEHSKADEAMASLEKLYKWMIK